MTPDPFAQLGIQHLLHSTSVGCLLQREHVGYHRGANGPDPTGSSHPTPPWCRRCLHHAVRLTSPSPSYCNCCSWSVQTSANCDSPRGRVSKGALLLLPCVSHVSRVGEPGQPCPWAPLALPSPLLSEMAFRREHRDLPCQPSPLPGLLHCSTEGSWSWNFL